MRRSWAELAGCKTAPAVGFHGDCFALDADLDPLVGSSSMLTQRSIVDLPDPEPPMIATTSPFFADSDTPLSTSRSPNHLVQTGEYRRPAAFRLNWLESRISRLLIRFLYCS
jgi:hypothetical protein